MTVITMSTALYNFLLFSIGIYFLTASYNHLLDIKLKIIRRRINKRRKHPPDR